jgi:hypothetical protein
MKRKTQQRFLMFSREMERTTIFVRKRCHRRCCYNNGEIIDTVVDDICIESPCMNSKTPFLQV